MSDARTAHARDLIGLDNESCSAKDEFARRAAVRSLEAKQVDPWGLPLPRIVSAIPFELVSGRSECAVRPRRTDKKSALLSDAFILRQDAACASTRYRNVFTYSSSGIP